MVITKDLDVLEQSTTFANAEASMKSREFLNELPTMRSSFQWKVVGSKKAIRGTSNGRSAGVEFDPITALCFIKTGEVVPKGQWTRAAAKMNLQWADCAELVAAFNYDWDPSTRQGALRQQILAALNLRSEVAKMTNDMLPADYRTANTHRA
jgi:hypothetical protein